MVWDSHLFQNFPQCIVIHIVKGFGIVNKAEIDVFLELSCFYHDPADVGNLISVVDVTGDRSKVRCCKEQYCIGTWNVRSMLLLLLLLSHVSRV